MLCIWQAIVNFVYLEQDSYTRNFYNMLKIIPWWMGKAHESCIMEKTYYVIYPFNYIVMFFAFLRKKYYKLAHILSKKGYLDIAEGSLPPKLWFINLHRRQK
jgi:hypothetical protein